MKNTNLKEYDIVLVPFPFTEVQAQKLRPALLLSSSMIQTNNHGIFAMITSSHKQQWKHDILLGKLDFLSKNNCILRLAKLMTLDVRLIRRVIGSIDGYPSLKEQISKNLKSMFPI
jgi:mRNA interferase MazF